MLVKLVQIPIHARPQKIKQLRNLLLIPLFPAWRAAIWFKLKPELTALQHRLTVVRIFRHQAHLGQARRLFEDLALIQ
ncbi:MAG: hypothetical protein A3G60_02240 [Candidatus Ryanbacteria bacterium RIFCSPLOWO2_12_FULL_47_9c]|uniref:Uncharacterized protein n=1 Tax=Candidatus Ryanbacteria bacterium RIFCSPLOWO2_12_FULL_47_9c TaxID=1802131 RepID=A0A1G2H371_9BACT|nr:MAG: hypothetical protein A3G60_02240 [Candidatus Ryanbacteria bacterium RIFCSPLOWO2_12_FULL_47_9c]